MKINSNRGFSLLEVMFTTVILTLTLGAFLYALNQSNQLIEATRGQSLALNAARERLEIISASVTSAAGLQGQNGQQFSVLDSSGNALIAPQGQQPPLSLAVAPVTGSNNLFDTTLTVRWQDHSGREVSQELKTTIFTE